MGLQWWQCDRCQPPCVISAETLWPDYYRFNILNLPFIESFLHSSFCDGRWWYADPLGPSCQTCQYSRADSIVRRQQGPGLNDELTALLVPHHGDRQTHGAASLVAGVHCTLQRVNNQRQSLETVTRPYLDLLPYRHWIHLSKMFQPSAKVLGTPTMSLMILFYTFLSWLILWMNWMNWMNRMSPDNLSFNLCQTSNLNS